MTPGNLTPDDVDHPAIREALIARRDARAETLRRKRDVIELEQTREQAGWTDARAVDEARVAGRPEPKRKHVVEHDQKLDTARHELKVAELAEQRAERKYGEALAKHHSEWVESVREDVASLEREWSDAVDALGELYARRCRADRMLTVATGGEAAAIGAIRVRPAQINGVDFAPIPDPTMRRNARAFIPVGDVLAMLSDLGRPELAEPIVAPGVGEAMKQSLDHAYSRRRGYADEDRARQGVRPMPQPPSLVTSDGASIYVPAGEED